MKFKEYLKEATKETTEKVLIPITSNEKKQIKAKIGNIINKEIFGKFTFWINDSDAVETITIPGINVDKLMDNEISSARFGLDIMEGEYLAFRIVKTSVGWYMDKKKFNSLNELLSNSDFKTKVKKAWDSYNKNK